MTPEAKRRKNQKKKQKQKQKKAAAAAATVVTSTDINENNDNIIQPNGKEASLDNTVEHAKGEVESIEQPSVEPIENIENKFIQQENILIRSEQTAKPVELQIQEPVQDPVVESLQEQIEEPAPEQIDKILNDSPVEPVEEQTHESHVKPVQEQTQEFERLSESVEQEMVDQKVLSDVADIDTDEVIVNNDDLLITDNELTNPIVSVLSNQTSEFIEEPVIEHISSREEELPLEQSVEPINEEVHSSTQEESDSIIQQQEVTEPVENALQVQESLHDDLFGSTTNNELMPWEQKQEHVKSEPLENKHQEQVVENTPLENEAFVPEAAEHAGDLFENNDTDETLPWNKKKPEEIQQENNVFEKDTPTLATLTNEIPPTAHFGEPLQAQRSMQEDDLFGETTHDDLMPWEQEQIETKYPEVVGDQPIQQQVVENSTIQEPTQHSDDLFEHNDDDEPLPWEENSNKNKQQTEEVKPESDVNGNANETPTLFEEDVNADATWLHHSDYNENLPQDETAGEDNKPETTEKINDVGLSEPSKKFSFLQEDDDLLEDDDSFLESEDEDEVVTQEPVKAESTVSSEGITLDQIPRSHSNNQSTNVSKYAPAHPTTTAPNQASTVPQDGTVGIVLPQQINSISKSTTSIPSSNASVLPSQPQLPMQTPPNNTNAQQVIEKLTVEKKKSDAYDFPMDLIANKVKPVHAKPVGVPTPKLANTPLIPKKGSRQSSISGPKIPGYQSLDAVSNMSVPVNPYAAVIKEENMIKKAPAPAVPVGIVPPSMNLPSSPTLANNSMTAMSSTSILPPPARGRTFSNISATSAQSNSRANMYAPQANLNMAPPKKSIQPSQYAPHVPQMTPAQFNFPPTNTNANMPLPIAPVNTNLGSVVPEVTSPSSYTPASRGNHARKKSSLYTPNSNENSSRYAPTVHPQYQQQQQGNIIAPQVGTQASAHVPALYQSNMQGAALAPPQQQLSGKQYHPANVATNPMMPPQNVMPQLGQQWPYPSGNGTQLQPPKASVYGNKHSAHSSYGAASVVDNAALLSRQFPIFQWNSSNRIVYGIPVGVGGYGGNVLSTISSFNVVNYDTIVKSNSLFKSFPGPLTYKSKKKDVEKWLVTINSELNLDTNSVEALVWKMLQIKLSDNYSFQDISEALYDTQELRMYLSQPFNPNLPQPNAYRLDTIGQMRVLASLQIGDHDTALRDALAHKDYTMAVLIGSLVSKDKWTNVVDTYLSEGFHNNPDNNTCTSLLSIIFQAFIGNAKATVRKLYSNPAEGAWAMNNWRIIVAALLVNITTDATSKKIPPVIMEFLLEFAIFLYHKDLKLAASILFMIVDCPLTNIPVLNDSDVTFEHIGNPSSEQSVLWSELYEYHSILLNPKLSNYDILLPQKVYHGLCLQEQGLTNLATKYSDYIASKLKQLNKKDIIALNMSSRLEELQSRLVESGSSWLAKPKLSSVWGQLDKSFNKYIGGDEEVPQQPSHKKVFDNYTPTTSNNSSLADLTQHQGFTPYRVNAERSTQDSNVLFAGEPRYPREGILPTTDPLFRATSYSAINEHIPHFPGPPSMKRTMSKSSGMELKKTMSALEPAEALNTLHTQPPHFNPHLVKGSPRKTNIYNAGHNSQLASLHQENVNTVQPISRAPLPVKRDSFAKPVEMSKPQIRQEPSHLTMDENAQGKVNQYAPAVQQASAPQLFQYPPSVKPTPSVHPVEPLLDIPTVQPVQPEITTEQHEVVRPGIESETIEEIEQENSSQATIQDKTDMIGNVEQTSVTPVTIEKESETTVNSVSQYVPQVAPVQTEPVQAAPVQTKPVQAAPIQNEPVQTKPVQAAPIQTEQVQAAPVQTKPVQAAPIQTEQVQAEQGQAAPVQNEPVQNEPVQTEQVQPEPVQATPVQPEPVQATPVQPEQVQPEPVQPEPAYNEPLEEEVGVPSKEVSLPPRDDGNIGLGITEAEGSILPPPPIGIKKTFTPGSPVSPYAPVQRNTKKAAKRTLYTPTLQTYSSPNVLLENNNTPIEGNMYGFSGNNSVPADLSKRAEDQYSPMEANEEVSSTVTSEVEQESTRDSVPPLNVMKREDRPSEIGGFEPIIKPSSSVLTGIPSVKEGGIQYNDEVEEESDDEDDDDEEECRRKESENKKEKKEKKKKKDDDKSGWFGWLKKDPSEKKAVKAKLGHQNNFYYDEKLKRWVNKDATEEEKQKLQESAAPPPPPVVKRKDKTVKTAPRQSFSHPKPETPALGSLPTTVLPVNPFSGKPIPQTPSSVTVSPSSEAPAREVSPPVSNGIPVNLTGKKSNGLDDILNISSATVNRRKKKAGRGYVNVMENR